MATLPFVSYNAFSDTALGGSPAVIILGAAELSPSDMARIAREAGTPATCFISAIHNGAIEARFFSTVTEMPMCGHGTVALMSCMVEQGLIDLTEGAAATVELRLPEGNTVVEICRQADGRPFVMLDIAPPVFRRDPIDVAELAELLGVNEADFNPHLSHETAVSDFIHLVVPMQNLAAMRRMKPDFDGIVRLCQRHDIQTVATFCTEVAQEDHSVHVRDFCPRVGVAESAAAGTTNGALGSYLIRHGMAAPDGAGRVVIQAEQGHEINRPSSIRAIALMKSGGIARLQVGGVACRIADGQMQIPIQEPVKTGSISR